MKYNQTVTLKNGAVCLLRGCTAQDAESVLDIFNRTHAETDHLLTYPDESSFTVQQEADFLAEKDQSENAIEIGAFVDGRLVGTAGISPIGGVEKLRHRAEFGIGIEKAAWGLGIGRALTAACIGCAKAAGYAQLELDVVAENSAAIALYRSLGFVEYGRNPRGFRSRYSGWQELVLMCLDFVD